MRQDMIVFANKNLQMTQLQKYTWLIDTIRRAGKISHKDLSDRWERNKDLSACKMFKKREK